MSTYLVRYSDESTDSIELPYDHAPAVVVLAAIEEQNGRSKRDVLTIVKSPGKPDAREVYKRVSSGSNPLLPATRLFVSFVYEPVGSKPGTREFGTALLDMEYEPYEQAHLDHLTGQIGEHFDSEKVIVLGWQKVERN